MSTQRMRRIAKEIADVHSDPLSEVEVDAVGNGEDLTHLKGSFKGPPGTQYDGGLYKIDIKIPNEYPFRPPIMKFENKIWHPNISSQTGAICLDTLSTGWSPVLTLKTTLQSLQSLLCTPEPSDPQDAVAAAMYIKNRPEFDRVATEWAVKYANAPKRSIGEGSGGSTAESKQAMKRKSREEEEAERVARYGGYNQAMIDQFVVMGFDLDRVVDAFDYVGIDRNGGEEYTLEEAYMGDITARLLGEP